MKGNINLHGFTKMNALDELKFNPLSYIAGLGSPIGVYLRREIFHEEAEADVGLKEKLYEKMVADQCEDGSWDQLFVHTANNLWNLALLGYDAEDKHVRRGLEWLLSVNGRLKQGLGKAPRSITLFMLYPDQTTLQQKDNWKKRYPRWSRDRIELGVGGEKERRRKLFWC